MNLEKYIHALRQEISFGLNIWGSFASEDFLSEKNRDADAEIIECLASQGLVFRQDFVFSETPEGAQDGVLRASVRILNKVMPRDCETDELYFSKFRKLVVSSMRIPPQTKYPITQEGLEIALKRYEFIYLSTKNDLALQNLGGEDWFHLLFSSYD